MDDNTGPPPSPPLSPPAPEQPLTLATLPDDALALYVLYVSKSIQNSSSLFCNQFTLFHALHGWMRRLIHRLHDGKELLPLR